METNKWCPKCQQDLSRDLFYRNKAQSDGLAPYCKKCWSAFCSTRHARLRAGVPDKRRVQMELVRHDYFHAIERPIQAYVLGLLASDGNVSSNRPRIQFTVNENDRILTEVVRNELAPGSSILTPPCRDYRMAKVCFTSPMMHTDLAALGIIPRKSLVLTWPEALPTSFINSYLLGILDGDGWITMDRRKHTPYYTIGFMSASPPFLERAAHEITEAINIPLAHLNHYPTAYAIRYGGQKAVLLNDWLHRDLPGLERKRIPAREKI